MTTTLSLYQQVVKTTQEYLGPAAERFICRQIETHIHKPPEEINGHDVEKLVDWIKIAIALLTEDDETVENFTHSLLELAKQEHA